MNKPTKYHSEKMVMSRKRYGRESNWRRLNLRNPNGTLFTIDDYDDLINKQNWECGICGVSFKGAKKYPPIDHDHVTGIVRAILCSRCNTQIGMLESNLITSCLKYLAKYKSIFYQNIENCLTNGTNLT